jgi:hypothetical protein
MEMVENMNDLNQLRFHGVMSLKDWYYIFGDLDYYFGPDTDQSWWDAKTPKSWIKEAA